MGFLQKYAFAKNPLTVFRVMNRTVSGQRILQRMDFVRSTHSPRCAFWGLKEALSYPGGVAVPWARGAPVCDGRSVRYGAL